MTIKLLAGDCRDILPTLAADSVHCVVTSPPYYGLRDYGTALWDGGDAACSHVAAATGSTQNKGNNGRNGAPFRDTCGKCGAVRIDRQIGLEATPDEYLATMVAVFREVRRVMRNDAVAFINMGDSYSDKQLLLMPARLALALQADGWWVRSDIIWHKPNPMPESCTDRPTSAHEHVFLLTRSSRYYYDADAVREAESPNTASFREMQMRFMGNPERHMRVTAASRELRADVVNDRRTQAGLRQTTGPVDGRRNLRNVWTLATHPYSQCHFATFPPELAERCIRAGTSERGCCAACGKPWRRTQETVRPSSWEARKAAGHPMSGYHAADGAIASRQQVDDNAAGGLGWVAEKRTTGWQPGCKCNAEVVPCRVLDCFAGAGTTLLVADRLQRDAIGIELNVAYTEMAMERCRADAPLFTSFPPAEPPEDERIADLFADAAE